MRSRSGVSRRPGAVDIDAGGNITLNGAITGTTTVTITSDANASNNGTIDVNGKITASGVVSLDADGDITIDAAIDPTTVNLDSDDDVTVNAAVVATTAINVRAGNNDGTGNATISGTGSLLTSAGGSDILIRSGATTGLISLVGNVTAVDRLSLTSNGTGNISQTGGTILAAELQVVAVGNATLNQATNNVGTLAADLNPGIFAYTDADGLAIGTLATVGITTGTPGNGGAVTINATSGTITVNSAINTSPGTGGGVAITGSVTLSAALTAGGGTITLNGNTAATSDLVINSPISSDNTIGLQAPRDIIINAVVSTTGAGSDVIALADSNNDGAGGLLVTTAGQVNSAGDTLLQGSDGINAAFTGGTEAVEIASDGANSQVTAAGNVTIGQAGTMTPALADVLINGVVKSTASGGNVRITANDDIRFGVNGDVTGVDAFVSALAGYNPITASLSVSPAQIVMANGTIIDGGTGTAEVAAIGNITLGQVRTTGNSALINIASLNGAILDGGDLDTDVVGANVLLGSSVTPAGGGIGTDADDLDTAIGTLAAHTESGDINISNTGALIVGTINFTPFLSVVSGFSSLIGVVINDIADDNTGSDNITIVASSPLTVNSLVANNDGGNITLTSTNDGGNDDHLTISANVRITGGDATIDADGNIDLNAGTDLIINNNAVVSTDASGVITGDADRAISISTASAAVQSVNGGITLTANAGGHTGNFVGITIDDAAVSSISGSVSLTGTGGDTGNNNHGVVLTNTATISSGIGAATLSIMGTAGAGTSSDGVNANNVAAHTFVSTVDAAVSITGSTAGDDGMELSNSAINTTGATGTITILGTSTSNNGASSEGVLLTGAGTTITSVAGAIAITGTTAGGGTAGDGVEIAAGVTLAINATGAATLTITGTGDGAESGVQIDSPIASGTGFVTIRSEDGGSTTDDITFGAAGDITSTSGTITIDAENAGDTADVFMADGALIDAGSGLIDIDADVDVTLGGLLTSGEVQITVATGAIIDGGNIHLDIDAGSAALRTQTGIGSANPLETNLSTLAASNLTSGNIHINDVGANSSLLTIGTVNGLMGITNDDANNIGPFGFVNISNASPLTVALPVMSDGDIVLSALESAAVNADNLTISAAVTADNVVNTARVILNAGDNVVVTTATGTVTSDTTITINVEESVDANGDGTADGANLDAGSGGEVTVIGSKTLLVAPGGTTINGGADATAPGDSDIFNITPQNRQCDRLQWLPTGSAGLSLVTR